MRKTLTLLFTLCLSLMLTATVALACEPMATANHSPMSAWSSATGVPNGNVVATTANPNTFYDKNANVANILGNANAANYIGPMAGPKMAIDSASHEKLTLFHGDKHSTMTVANANAAKQANINSASHANLSSGYNANGAPLSNTAHVRHPQATPEARLKQPIHGTNARALVTN